MALPDDIITQREAGAQAAEDGEREDSHEEEEEEEQEAVVLEGQPRRRKPARLPEVAPKAEPAEKLRGKRQKDFDISEQNASSDEESQKKERSRATEEPWTQNQQKLLELALQQYPKGSSDRWDKIAKCVPSKSKVGEAGRGQGLCTGFRFHWSGCSQFFCLIHSLSPTISHELSFSHHRAYFPWKRGGSVRSVDWCV